MSYLAEEADVIVVGGGHAGCEAALAAARMGLKTIIFAISLDSIAMMPCNPSIGGSSKGHLVREIDALGGEMGKNIDKTYIQTKMLNTGKGPAVYSLRAQADKGRYQREMKRTLEKTENLYYQTGRGNAGSCGGRSRYGSNDFLTGGIQGKGCCSLHGNIHEGKMSLR